jgi:hypothetical protein
MKWGAVGRLIVVLLAGLLMPIMVQIPTPQFNRRVLAVATPGIRIQPGVLSTNPALDGSSTIIVGALNAIQSGTETGNSHPPRFFALGSWVAVAAVMTPATWSWRSNLGSRLTGRNHTQTLHSITLLGRALQHGLVLGYRLRGSDAPENVAPFSYVRHLIQSVTITTKALPPSLVRLASQGLYYFNAPSICSDTNTMAARCNVVTVLWVRWRSAQQASQVPLRYLPYCSAALR